MSQGNSSGGVTNSGDDHLLQLLFGRELLDGERRGFLSNGPDSVFDGHGAKGSNGDDTVREGQGELGFQPIEIFLVGQ